MNNSKKTGTEMTPEYIENDVKILEHCFYSFVKFNINTYKLNHLHNISLPGYSFDFFLKLSKVEFDTIQGEQMLKDFIRALRGGICGVMGYRYVNININSQSQSQNHSHNRRQIWYIDANNIYD